MMPDFSVTPTNAASPHPHEKAPDACQGIEGELTEPNTHEGINHMNHTASIRQFVANSSVTCTITDSHYAELIQLANLPHDSREDQEHALNERLIEIQTAADIAALGLDPTDWDAVVDDLAIRFVTVFDDPYISVVRTERSDGTSSQLDTYVTDDVAIDWSSAQLKRLALSAMDAALAIDNLDGGA